MLVATNRNVSEYYWTIDIVVFEKKRFFYRLIWINYFFLSHLSFANGKVSIFSSCYCCCFFILLVKKKRSSCALDEITFLTFRDFKQWHLIDSISFALILTELTIKKKRRIMHVLFFLSVWLKSKNYLTFIFSFLSLTIDDDDCIARHAYTCWVDCLWRKFSF